MGTTETVDAPEELILRVASSTNVASLAAAISNGIYDSKQVTLRAIGAGPVNQGVKAIAIAQQYVAARGLVLACRPGFVTIQMPDGETSGILLRVFIVTT